ncbi:hypothetical protein [Corynebacterium sp.]|uniref:hypothetical protein n=1 Tax=Corynebacterium sp. TaxID=1720 RepID=UPI0025C34C83|nr:hypothetical protein [Corynebacterium sp.]
MPLSRRKFLLGAGVVTLAAVPLGACAGDGSPDGESGDGAASRARRARPVSGTGVTVVDDDPSGVATSATVFSDAATAVIVTATADGHQREAGCALARDHGVPVFVDSGPADGDAGPDGTASAIAAELERLGVSEVVLVGGTGSPSLPDDAGVTVHTTGDEGGEPAWPDGAADSGTGDGGPSGVALASPASSPASTATAAAAGFSLVRVHAADPRSSDESIDAALGELDGAGNLIGLGNAFGEATDLGRRSELARTVEGRLPGGGQVLFPGRRIIALYGHANEPLLGVMGEQPPQDAVTRARSLAAEYEPDSDVPVIPAFEIIVTVAADEPGPSGGFSYYSDPAEVRPWIDAIVSAGGYAIIDIQPGRETLLQQAQHYADLLKNPGVGLALDPEWRLGPGDQPMADVGHVDASEINEVAEWLDGLVAAEKLPQKLLMIHQFQLQMIRNREAMVTGTDNVSVAVHCDGHGTQGIKAETWNVILQGLDPAIALGWKNFIDEDEPMLTPGQTAAIVPTPDIVSYQ